jgi:site-specific DNA-adenine methylase
VIGIRYVGSKNSIAKHIVPIIQSYIDEKTVGYLEPFVGGANVIDKINCANKIGSDIHENLIALLKKTQTDVSDMPERILEEEYMAVKENQCKYSKWFVGLVGFCSSFSAKYFAGYARNSKNDNSGKWSQGAITNLKNQSANLQDICFDCKDFREYNSEKLKGYLILKILISVACSLRNILRYFCSNRCLRHNVYNVLLLLLLYYYH